MTEQKAVPAAWEDPRVQQIYELLCDTPDSPTPEEHWEGWVARLIVGQVLEPAVAAERWRYNAAVESHAKLTAAVDKLLAERDGLRAELAEAVSALPQAVRNERERCAKIVDDTDTSGDDHYIETTGDLCDALAATIRRGPTK